MGENQASLLTERQRDYLRGKLSPSNESQMQSRIRERVFEGLRRDGSILLDGLGTKERRELFREWENQEESDGRNKIDAEKFDEHGMLPFREGDFEIGLHNLLAFLYLGIEETNLNDFEETLERSLQEAAKERGEYLTEFTYDAEFKPRPSAEDLFEGLKNSEIEVGDLNTTQLNKLLTADSVDWHDLPHEQKMEIVDWLETMQSLKEKMTSDEFWERYEEQRNGE